MTYRWSLFVQEKWGDNHEYCQVPVSSKQVARMPRLIQQSEGWGEGGAMKEDEEEEELEEAE